MTLLLASLIDASVVLTIALIAVVVLRRRSAAVRHAILATAVICAALMPVLELVLPDLAVIPWHDSTTASSSGIQRSSEEVVAGTSAAVIDTAGQPSIDWTAVLAGLWLAASVVTLLLLVTDLLRLAALRRRGTPVTGSRRALLDSLCAQMGVTRPVALLQTNTPSLLVTYGFRKPGIIIPAASIDWTDERLRIVLQHELAHIARHDAAIQFAGEVLRVVQPINPLVWVTCRRLRQESEYACDDAVLGAGVVATTYAGHLLDVARQLSHRHAAWAAAPAIAHPSTLERRIVAMLQKHTNRRPLTHRGWSAAVIIAAGISLPIAAASFVEPEVPVQAPPSIAAPVAAPVATPAPTSTKVISSTVSPAPRVIRTPEAAAVTRQPGAITGQVTDQTGGVIPGANVTLTDRQASSQSEAITNSMGRFTFPNVTGAEYDLVTRLSGFKTVVSRVTVSSGATMMQTIVLPIGSLSETINVSCSPESFSLLRAFFPVLSAQSTPVRVGGQIREPRKIRDVRPTCPAGAASGEHVVRLTGTIGTDGVVSDVAPSEGAAGAPADLIAASLEAVRQWAFTPTQLNGQPVDVTIEITIKFTKA